MNSSTEGGSRPVVASVDWSEQTDLVLAWASVYAECLGAPLRAVNVKSPVATYAIATGEPLLIPVDGAGIPSELGAAEAELLERVTTVVSGDLAVSAHIRDGDPAREILDECRETNAQLLVIGRRGHGGLASFMLGSVSNQVASEAPLPVAVIPPHVVSTDRRNTIVCAVDGSDDSFRALDAAVVLADGLWANLDIVYVIDDTYTPADSLAGALPFLARHSGDNDTAAAAAVDRAKQRASEALSEHRVNTIVAHGEPADTLALIGRERLAMSIVMGSHGLSGWSAAVLGSVTKRTLQRADCPVIVTRRRPE